jgi:NAD(P)H-flavin reductase
MGHCLRVIEFLLLLLVQLLLLPPVPTSHSSLTGPVVFAGAAASATGPVPKGMNSTVAGGGGGGPPPPPAWTVGVPTTLLRKVTLVEADPAVGRLPVHTLTFAIPSDEGGVMTAPAKPHGQVAIDLGDVVKMVIPNYKPKSYSISALRVEVGEFDVTLKVYPNGRASGVLDRLKVGDHIYSFGKSANRTRNPGLYVGIVAFGVGITEGLPVARAECEKLSAVTGVRPSGEGQGASAPPGLPKVKLLWASRTMEDTFWHDEIRSLREQFPSVFEMVFLLSRQEREGCLHGRVSPQLLDDVFRPPLREEARFLSVGTKEMMRMTDDMFAEIGYPMPRHHLLPKGGADKWDKSKGDSTSRRAPGSEEL